MRVTRKGASRFLRGQSGFNLIEVLVSVAIIAAIGTAVIGAVNTHGKAIQVLDEQVQAANLVTAYLEGIRQLPYSDDASPYSGVNDSVVKPPQYVIAMDFTYSPNGTDWFPDSNGGAYKLQKIRISVSREAGKPILSACTFKTTRIQ